MALFDKAGKAAGVDAVEQVGEVVNDIQADLDRRTAALVALLQGKRIKITTVIEVEDKP